MAYLRFHRSKKLLPGVRLNMSGSGPSLSLGVRGARVNVGPQGVRTTLGVPGTGLSVIQRRSWPKGTTAAQKRQILSEEARLEAEAQAAADYAATPAWKKFIAKVIAYMILIIPLMILMLFGLCAMAFGVVVLYGVFAAH